MRNLENNVVLDRVSNAAAAAQTAVTSSSVDMANFEGVRFIAFLGAIDSSGAPELKVQQSSDDGSTDAYSDLEGSAVAAADTNDNGLLVVDVKRPLKRYLRAVLSRSGGDAALDGIIAEKYGARLAPVTQTADVIDSAALVSPDEGTA